MAYKHSSFVESLVYMLFFSFRDELLCLLWIARNIILIIILSFFALIAAISSIIMLMLSGKHISCNKQHLKKSHREHLSPTYYKQVRATLNKNTYCCLRCAHNSDYANWGKNKMLANIINRKRVRKNYLRCIYLYECFYKWSDAMLNWLWRNIIENIFQTPP